MFDPAMHGDQTDPSHASESARSTPPLSPTEKRVCALLLQRMTEQRIAEQLGRSPNTVHVHVRNIYRKLAVRTRTELLEYPGIEMMVLESD